MSNTTPTAARPNGHSSPHYYHAETGAPMHQIPTVDGKKMKSPTIADARKLGLLPSVTTIIDRILRKPDLEAWKEEQACLAVLTTPRNEGEEMDAFVYRVLHVEEQHRQEARDAADLGKKLHKCVEAFFRGEEVDPMFKTWILPACEAVLKYGVMVGTEKVLIGDGYAGTTDLLLDCPECWWLWDIKTTKSVPDAGKPAWPEHRIQLSAYAAALKHSHEPEVGLSIKPIRTGNVYISTKNEGRFAICEHEEWGETYSYGFEPLLVHWQWANKYWPGQVKKVQRPAAAETTIVLHTDEAYRAATANNAESPPKKRKIVMAIGIPTLTGPQPQPPEAA